MKHAKYEISNYYMPVIESVSFWVMIGSQPLL